MSTKLRVGWHREHFLSPLLQFVEKDKGETVELIECPGGTGEMQVCLGDSNTPSIDELMNIAGQVKERGD